MCPYRLGELNKIAAVADALGFMGGGDHGFDPTSPWYQSRPEDAQSAILPMVIDGLYSNLPTVGSV
jgi:hypothetical protein